MAQVSIQNLRKEFKGKVAVQDLTLEIADKELLILLGPSGCGKTTTLNCIAGLETATSGRILFDGKDVTDLAPHVRNVAMVFQSSLLYPHLTGRQNIALSLRKSGLSKSEIEARIKEAAALLHIEPLLDKLPSQMSGGERQRVATAKAIVRQPSVFLLDEPFAALDAALRNTLRAEIVNLQKRLGTTMVMVTHDQVEAMTMGDRLAVMNHGELQQVGTPHEMYNKPANLFVAGFVGSPPMNFFSGSVQRSGDQLQFVSSGFQVSLPPKLRQALEKHKGDRFVLGVRPQHLQVHKTEQPGALRVQVFALEYLGKELVVIMEHGQEKIRAIAPPDFQAEVGEAVFIKPETDHVFLFDAASTKNVLVA